MRVVEKTIGKLVWLAMPQSIPCSQTIIRGTSSIVLLQNEVLPSKRAFIYSANS